MSRRGWILFAAMCLIWGLPYLLIRVAVEDLSPATVVFARTAVGAVVLLPVALWRRSLPALRGHLGWLLAYTAVEVAVPWLLLTAAEQHLTSSLSGLLVAATPLAVVTLGRVVRVEESVDTRRLVGLLVGLCGVAALVGLQLGHIDLVAVLMVGGVAVGYAAGPLLLVRRLSTVPGLAVVTASLSITAVVYLPFVLVAPPRHVGTHAALSVVTLAIVCTSVAFLVFFALISEVGPSRAIVITYVNPAVAVALGVAVLGEHLTTGIAVGFPLIIAGSVVATARTAATRSASEPVEYVGSG